jgi:ribosomal protein S18 acetylase RimI-like enzyme
MEARQSVVLRAAQPVFEEGQAYGRYLEDLAPGFRYTLGRGAADAIAHAFVQPGHDLSYEHVTFAELDGSIVGVVAGYTTEAHRGSTEGALAQALGRRGPLGVRTAALAKWLRYFGPRVDGEFYVWALAVSEGLRGQGIGSVLMDFAEDRARAGGSDRFVLDADAKNDGARRFYERRGMTVESGWPSLPLVPPQVVRMSKSL